MTVTAPNARPMTGADHYAEAGRLLAAAEFGGPDVEKNLRLAEAHTRLAQVAIEAAKLGSDGARMKAATDWYSAFGGYADR